MWIKTFGYSEGEIAHVINPEDTPAKLRGYTHIWCDGYTDEGFLSTHIGAMACTLSEAEAFPRQWKRFQGSFFWQPDGYGGHVWHGPEVRFNGRDFVTVRRGIDGGWK